MKLENVRNKRVLILNDGRGMPNYGLDITSQSLIGLFESGGNQIFTIPNIEFHRRTSINVPRYLYYLIRPIAKSFVGNSIDIPYSLDDYNEAEKSWFESTGSYKTKVEKLIKNSDVVVFNAEGSCHSNNYGPKVGLFLLYMANRYGKNTFFINGSVTFSSNSTDIFLPVFRHIAKYIDAFYLREKLSENSFKKLIAKQEVSYLPDCAFKSCEDYPKTSSVSSVGGKYFLVSSSMNRPMGSLNPQNLPLGRVVDRLARQFGKPIFIVKDLEDRYLIRFARSRGYEVYSGNDRLKLFSLFRHASFLLSGRFHHLILACVNGCPAIPMDTTSGKNRGITELMPKLEHSQELINPTSLLNSMDFIVEQAEILSKPAVRSEAKEALLSFSNQHYKLLCEGFGL